MQSYENQLELRVNLVYHKHFTSSNNHYKVQIYDNNRSKLCIILIKIYHKNYIVQRFLKPE
ncbi:hypothetical protein T190130A13A_60053 [Tenacibaculum sp. 190130A14a]|uniref:Uncharacterized protein n=1 Tax=Tenacibaculum polynesiense TaxID=3137857 RepID=A0ABP1F3K6_9FLAO